MMLQLVFFVSKHINDIFLLLGNYIYIKELKYILDSKKILNN